MLLSEVAHAVRTSRLQDPGTLAAFAVAARSALVPEWSAAEARVAGPSEPARPADDDGGALDPQQSLIEFNRRVLAAAEDDRTPLLERLRYLAILSTNLDELYMSYGEDAERDRIGELLGRQQRGITECLARLADRGHRLRTWSSLDAG